MGFTDVGDVRLTRGEYEAAVRRDYRYNRAIGLAQGVLAYAATGFYSFSVIFPKLVFDLSGSEFLVGLLTAIMNAGLAAAMLFGVAALEHLRSKKIRLQQYSLAYRLTWAVLAAALLLLPGRYVLPAVLVVFTAGQFCLGLYNLAFFDFTARIMPTEHRGSYLGLRYTLGLLVQATTGFAAGLLLNRYGGSGKGAPLAGYAVCFLLAFLLHLADFGLISKHKETPAVNAGRRERAVEKIRSIPALLRADPGFRWFCFARPMALANTFALSFFIIFVQQQVPITGANIGALTAGNLVAWASGSFIWGRIANRIGFIRVLQTTTGTFALAFLLLPYLRSYTVLFIFYCGSGFLMGGHILSSDGLSMEFGRPEIRPSYIAAANIISAAAGIVLPIPIGLLGETLSLHCVFTLVGLLMLAAAAILAGKVRDPRAVGEYENMPYSA